jgi:hypothetical protein
VDWTCTQDEKGIDHQNNCLNGSCKDNEVEADTAVHGKQSMRQRGQVQIGQTLR